MTPAFASPAAEFRSRRLALGLSQEKLARALGVVSTTVSHWERANRAIPPIAWTALSYVEDQQQKEGKAK